MKAEIVVYRIVSFLLAPITILFGLSALFGLLSIAANPSALFGVLLVGNVVFYMVCSFIFLIRVVGSGGPCREGLRRSLRTSAIFAIGFCVMIVTMHLTIVSNAEIVSELAGEMHKQPGIPEEMTYSFLEQSIKNVFTFFMIVALLLILHIIITFRLLNKYCNGDIHQKLDIEN